jgi:hypothetical protein
LFPGKKEQNLATEAKCPVVHGTDAQTRMGGNETESPMHGAVTTTSRQISRNFTWWPHQLNLAILHQNNRLADPMGEEFNYAEQFKSLDLDAVVQDQLAAMVAGRLRPLRPVLHPHGVAQRRHLPHRRRPRRGGHGHAAFLSPQ